MTQLTPLIPLTSVVDSKRSVTTSRNVAVATLKLVAYDALAGLLSRLLVGNLVNRNYEPKFAEVGETVNVQIPGLPEGSPDSLREIRLENLAQATFVIPDASKTLCVPDLLNPHLEPVLEALAEKIERDLLNLYGGFRANIPAVKVLGKTPAETEVDLAECCLFKAGVLPIRDKYLVVDADEYCLLKQAPQFKEFSTAGLAGINPLVRGPVGFLGNLFVIRSNNVAKSEGETGSKVLSHGIAFAKEAIGLVIRRPPRSLETDVLTEYAELGNFGMEVSMKYDSDTRSQQFTLRVLYGVAILKDSFGIQVNPLCYYGENS